MKKLLASVLLLPTLAFAQTANPEFKQIDKTVTCGDTKTIFNVLKNAGEEPVWVGRLEKSKMVVWVDTDKQGWSIVQYVGDIACVIDVGQGYSVSNKNLIKRSISTE
jgi:hypothetical protein